jgi:tetratricopeptide (TPR) repeat protein
LAKIKKIADIITSSRFELYFICYLSHVATGEASRDMWEKIIVRTRVIVDELNKNRKPGRRTGQPEPDTAVLAELPAPLQRLRFHEVRIRVEGLLRQHTQPKGLLNRAPPLPQNHIVRTALLEKMKARLASAVSLPKSSQSACAKIALWGMAGIGKTSIAVAAVADPDIKRMFPDGIIWLTFGRDPSAHLQRQTELLIALGQYSGMPLDPKMGRSEVYRALEHKKCLIVLDDVWRKEAIELFDVGDTNSVILLTGRNREILSIYDPEPSPVDFLTTSEAQKLLVLSAGLNDAGSLPPSADRVLGKCAGLPLAIAILGAMVADGYSWELISDRLNSPAVKEIMHALPDYEYKSLYQAIHVSVASLSPDMERRFLELAVFPANAPIPIPTLVTYWKADKLTEPDIEEFVIHVGNRALLQRDALARLTVHDTIRDYVKARSRDNLKQMHTKFIESHRHACKDQWEELTKDGYICQFLPYHLAAAELIQELNELLLGNLRWLEKTVRETKGCLCFLLHLQILDRALPAPDCPTSFLQKFRVWLSAAFVRKMATDHSADSLSALVYLDHSDLAIGHAHISSWEMDRSIKLAKIAVALSSCQLDKELVANTVNESLLAFSQIEFSIERQCILGDLAACLFALGYKKEVLDLFRTELADLQESVRTCPSSPTSQFCHLLLKEGLYQAVAQYHTQLADGGMPSALKLRLSFVLSIMGMRHECISVIHTIPVVEVREFIKEYLLRMQAEAGVFDRILDCFNRNVPSDERLTPSDLQILLKVELALLLTEHSDRASAKDIIKSIFRRLTTLLRRKEPAVSAYLLDALVRMGYKSDVMQEITESCLKSAAISERELLVNAYLSMGNIEDGMKLLRKLKLEKPSSPEGASALCRMASTLMRHGHYEKSKKLLERAAEYCCRYCWDRVNMHDSDNLDEVILRLAEAGFRDQAFKLMEIRSKPIVGMPSGQTDRFRFLRDLASAYICAGEKDYALHIARRTPFGSNGFICAVLEIAWQCASARCPDTMIQSLLEEVYREAMTDSSPWSRMQSLLPWAVVSSMLGNVTAGRKAFEEIERNCRGTRDDVLEIEWSIGQVRLVLNVGDIVNGETAVNRLITEFRTEVEEAIELSKRCEWAAALSRWKFLKDVVEVFAEEQGFLSALLEETTTLSISGNVKCIAEREAGARAILEELRSLETEKHIKQQRGLRRDRDIWEFLEPDDEVRDNIARLKWFAMRSLCVCLARNGKSGELLSVAKLAGSLVDEADLAIDAMDELPKYGFTKEYKEVKKETMKRLVIARNRAKNEAYRSKLAARISSLRRHTGRKRKVFSCSEAQRDVCPTESALKFSEMVDFGQTFGPWLRIPVIPPTYSEGKRPPVPSDCGRVFQLNRSGCSGRIGA